MRCGVRPSGPRTVMSVPDDGARPPDRRRPPHGSYAGELHDAPPSVPGDRCEHHRMNQAGGAYVTSGDLVDDSPQQV